METDTPAVRDYVRGQLALLRAGHPDDCMTCDADGRCELQDMCRAYMVRGGAGLLLALLICCWAAGPLVALVAMLLRGL